MKIVIEGAEPAKDAEPELRVRLAKVDGGVVLQYFDVEMGWAGLVRIEHGTRCLFPCKNGIFEQHGDGWVYKRRGI